MMLFSPLWAEEPTTPSVYRETSGSGQFSVESNSEELNHSLLYLAEDARLGLSSFLRLPEERRFRVTMRVRAEKSSLRQVTLRGWLEGDQLRFTIGIPQPVPAEAVLRELTTVFLYEKILASQKVWKEEEELPLIPFWLVEGTLQRLFFRRVEVWQKVVDRAVRHQRAPDFKTVSAWTEPTDHFLESAWRQAFSFKAVQALTCTDVKKDRFSDWLSGGAEAGKMPPFVRETNRESDWLAWLAAPAPLTEVVMSWEETERRVGSLLMIPLKSRKGEEKNILARWDELDKVRKHWDLRRALSERINELVEVEASANFLWRSVIFQLRVALQQLKAERDRAYAPSKPVQAFANGRSIRLKPEDPIKPTYDELVVVVRHELMALQGRNKKIEDYLNWFVVTEKSGEVDPIFETFVKFKEDLDRFDGRKDDPLTRDAIRLERGQRD